MHIAHNEVNLFRCIGLAVHVDASECTAVKLANMVCEVVVSRYADFVSLPDAAEQEVISRFYYGINGMPGCIGGKWCCISISKIN